MTISLTALADIANEDPSKIPNLVLQIDGDPTIYGAVLIEKFAEYGDDIFYGDSGLTYGSRIGVPGQEDIISFQKGTTTNITQNVNIDTGIGNSIQSLQIALVDKNGVATELITPGEVIDDILGARCTVYFGYQATAFPDDYIVLFKGNVDQVVSTAGLVTLNIIHPDNFKRANLFTKAENQLNGAINDVADPVVDDASTFFQPVTGPDGTIDTSILYYGVIDGSEIFSYTGISGNTFTGVTRGRLGTVATSHADGASVESFIRLTGNAISDIALKLMLSGWEGPYVEDITVSSFVTFGTSTISNAIFFGQLDIKDEYNIQVGDFVTITGATNGANNVTLSEVLEVVNLSDGSGSYIIVDDSLVSEITTSAVMSIRSQYDTWGEGRGMKMRSDDVDIDQHLYVFDSFLSSFEYDFYIKDSIDDAKEFLDKQVYNPAGCFSLVRQARASVGVQSPPLPTDIIAILDDTNIKAANTIALQRSSSRNFYNGVVYKFEDQALEDKLLKIEAIISGDSKARFGENIPDKYLVIEATGMREDLSARILADNVGTRRLESYQFGAEFINGLQLQLGAGLTIEPGDVVLLDLSALQVSDIQTGTRSGDPRLWRVNKKSFDVKTGDVKLDVVDTNFDKNVRYGLVSPSSLIKSVNSQTSFVINPSFGSPFGNNEFRKWEQYIGINVVIRETDYSSTGTAIQLTGVSGNTITLSADPGITLSAGQVMEFADYTSLGVAPIQATVKLIYASVTDDENDFADGGKAYRII